MPPSVLTSILVVSLLGSLHCAGMCGGLVAIASGMQQGDRSGLAHVGYHGGRLVAYVALGILAGFLGSSLDLAASAVGLGRAAAVLSGLGLFLWGLRALWNTRARVAEPSAVALRLPRSRQPPGWWPRASKRILAAVLAYRAPTRGLLLGLLSAVLPCGWLYAFVLGAAATAHPVQGALVMVAFWSGTVPVLLGLGLGLRRLLLPLGRHLPRATALGLMCAGLLTVLSRGSVAESALGSIQPMSKSKVEAAAHDAEPVMVSGSCPLHGSSEAETQKPRQK